MGGLDKHPKRMNYVGRCSTVGIYLIVIAQIFQVSNYVRKRMSGYMKVSNPLTIIAIFSGLAELLATVALTQLPLEVQKIFVYFVMVFPLVIVLLFFFVLYFKNGVLYAPSDYDDPDHYLVVNEVKKSITADVDEVFSELENKGENVDKFNVQEVKAGLERKISESLLLSTLTNREMAIYKMIMSGMSSKEIAYELMVSTGLVEAHISKIKNKLEVSSFS